MRILESISSTAWCIDRTGKAIRVNVHPFGALDDDAVEDAAWLICFVPEKGRRDKSLVDYISKQLCIDYGIDISWSIHMVESLVYDCIDTIECLRHMEPARIRLEHQVIERIMDIKCHNAIDDIDEAEVQAAGAKIKKYLNENYLRVRFGSLYQTYTERAGAIYFRTSSTDGFNWYNIIINFLDSIVGKYNVKEVTIERDQSATGDNKVYVDHMSLSDFLMKKPEVIESIKRCGTIVKG